MNQFRGHAVYVESKVDDALPENEKDLAPRIKEAMRDSWGVKPGVKYDLTSGPYPYERDGKTYQVISINVNKKPGIFDVKYFNISRQ